MFGNVFKEEMGFLTQLWHFKTFSRIFFELFWVLKTFGQQESAEWTNITSRTNKDAYGLCVMAAGGFVT